MVDTAKQANVQALRALFAQKEKTVIDALKAPKEISKDDPLQRQQSNESHNAQDVVSNGFAASAETANGQSSPSLSQRPTIGPKPVLQEQRSPSPTIFKDLVAQLQKKEGMYMPKSSLGSDLNCGVSKESLDTCDNNNAGNVHGTQAVLIKKETISMDQLNRKPIVALPNHCHTQSSPHCGNKFRKLFYRKRKIPSVEVLGPPPVKPSVPQCTTPSLAPPLPQRNEVILRESERSKEEEPPPLPNRMSLVSLGNGQPLSPPPRPCAPLPTTKSPPNRTPPLPLTAPPIPTADDELYGDTIEPERVQSLLSEYTEEEECGGRRSRPSSYIPPVRPKDPPPPPPSSSSCVFFTSEPVSFHSEVSNSSNVEEEIYEEMPEDGKYGPGPVYSNTKGDEKQKREEQKRLKKEQKEKEKHEKNCEKLRKKYGLTGDEIPVDAGIVKVDSKGSRMDLSVHKGETVLILRMENNPVGKWLAKNEKGKIGYVELTNIEVMTVRISQTIEEAIYSDIQTEDIYECTY